MLISCVNFQFVPFSVGLIVGSTNYRFCTQNSIEWSRSKRTWPLTFRTHNTNNTLSHSVVNQAVSRYNWIMFNILLLNTLLLLPSMRPPPGHVHVQKDKLLFAASQYNASSSSSCRSLTWWGSKYNIGLGHRITERHSHGPGLDYW